MRKHVHILGGCVWDERLVVDELQFGESVPVQSEMQLGGVARNVAISMFEANTGLKLTTHFICGDDAAGREMNEKLQELKFPHIQKIVNHSTAKYISIENQSGQVLYGLADMKIFQKFPQPENLAGDFLVTDTNPSHEFFAELAVDLPLYVVGTSPTKVLNLKPILHKVSGLFINKQEAIALVGESLPIQELATKLGVASVLITQGADRPVVYEEGITIFADEPESLDENTSHNGLGDRLSGLTLAHWFSKGGSLLDAVNHSLKIIGNVA